MVRVLKEHEEREKELLDAAQELFNRLGYRATPVSAIIEKVGVSKGTFYHYFDSKEHLLDRLTARFTERVLGRISAATDEDMDAITKLNTFFVVAGRWKAANKALIMMLVKALYRDENILLRHKVMRRMVSVCAPELTSIIGQGIREGVFDVPDPEDAAELVLRFSTGFRDVTAELFLRLEEEPEIWPLLERKISNFQDAVERILGAPKGSFRLIDEESMKAFRDGGAGRPSEGGAA